MNTTALQRLASTSQFFLLTLVFGLALIFKDSIQPNVLKFIINIVIIELPVLMYGWFIIFLFVPLAVTDNIWLRRGSFFLASLFSIGIASMFTKEYGYTGASIFLWLLYVNYGGVFVSNIEYGKRVRLAGEIAMRTILYLIIFMLLVGLLDLPNNIGSRWYRNEDALLFGIIYFSIATGIEFKRYFPRSANFLYHAFNDNYVRLPDKSVKYNGERLKAHVVKYSNTHYWWLILLSGIFLLVFTLSIIYAAASNPDVSWFAYVFLWLFMSPFIFIGIAFVSGGPWMAYKYFSAKPAFLSFQDHELKHENKLHAEGFIPKYNEKEVRAMFDMELICYKVSLPNDEFDISTTRIQLAKNLTNHTTELTSDDGTRFKVECKIPPIENIETQDRAYYVWHLQASMRDKNHQSRATLWKMAFTLPINQAH